MTLSLPAASQGQLPTAPGSEDASLQHSLDQSVKPHLVAKEADSNIQALIFQFFYVHMHITLPAGQAVRINNATRPPNILACTVFVYECDRLCTDCNAMRPCLH